MSCTLGIGIPEYFILGTETETVIALSDPITEGGVGRYMVEVLYRLRRHP